MAPIHIFFGVWLAVLSFPRSLLSMPSSNLFLSLAPAVGSARLLALCRSYLALGYRRAYTGLNPSFSGVSGDELMHCLKIGRGPAVVICGQGVGDAGGWEMGTFFPLMWCAHLSTARTTLPKWPRPRRDHGDSSECCCKLGAGLFGQVADIPVVVVMAMVDHDDENRHRVSS
ncbi:hypothetical protein B0T17DRAFT_503218 [Bombardia bombarda]|uniref:Uncharacterized protein n=1 Tax=Bombardia bombarda TaxID=252184 RepID=A0AA39XKJ6_9PEZI|nr:hypothetical protein B0T17DRAFT_503218 [Bombardia bombarda]